MAAKPIEIDGSRFSGPEELIDRALQLVERGGPYMPKECKIMAAAWPYLKDRPLASYADYRAADVCRTMYNWHPPFQPKPQPKTPFDEQIKEAELKRDRLIAELEAARERFWSAQDVLNSASGHRWIHDGAGWTLHPPKDKPSAREIAEARDALEEARAAIASLEPAVTAAMVRVNELGRRRGLWLASRN